MCTSLKLHLAITCLLNFLIFTPAAHASSPAPDSCECPKLSCNTDCEVEQDLSFYSEKCDAGKRVKSCARPTCVPLQNAPPVCAAGGVAAIVPAKVEAPDEKEVSREVASATKLVPAPQEIGRVQFISGEAYKVVTGDTNKAIEVGDLIYEKDRIQTGASGQVQVQFLSGNLINITPQSEVVISEASDSIDKAEKKRMVLELIKGKIRNRVEKKYDNQQNYYQVKTKAAVAGVRGTDFVVTYDLDNENATSKIETLSGQVELSDLSFERKVLIAKNEAASIVLPKSSLYNAREVAGFAAKGYLTPVYKLSEKQIEELQKETGFGRFVASADKTANQAKVNKQDAPICTGPEGALNQCSWICENNPAGEKRCRTDLPSVSCVRRICNANGVWSQPARLPAAYHDSCMANRAVVKPCDY